MNLDNMFAFFATYISPGSSMLCSLLLNLAYAILVAGV